MIGDKIKITIFTIIKNYFYIFIGIGYFIFFYNDKNNIFEVTIKNYFPYGDTIFNIFNGALAFVTISGIIGLIIYFLNNILKNIVKKRKFKLYELVGNIFLKYLNANKIFISSYIFILFLNLGNNILKFINICFLAIFLIIFIYFLGEFITIIFDKILIKKAEEKHINKNLLHFLQKFVIVFIWLIGIMIILSSLGFQITAIIAGAGVGGIAMAFAAQKSIANIFGAITILLNKPFKIGDYISIGEVSGTVKDLGLTYIKVVSDTGEIVMIPNETIISKNISNSSMREHRKANLGIGLEYDTNLESMKKGIKIIENILENYLKNEKIISYRVIFDSFGDFALKLQITYYSNTTGYTDFLKEKEEINLEIKKQFQEANINMAFPTQELIIKKD